MTGIINSFFLIQGLRDIGWHLKPSMIQKLDCKLQIANLKSNYLKLGFYYTLSHCQRMTIAQEADIFT